MTNVAVWQVSQRRPIDSEPGCCACLNKHLSFFCSARFSRHSGGKGAPRMWPSAAPASVPGSPGAGGQHSPAGRGREYKRAALYRSHSRLWSLSTMKNSYKLFPELNHLTSWHLVVFNFVTIGTVHSSQSQFFIL